jgi:hypothetical protein
MEHWIPLQCTLVELYKYIMCKLSFIHLVNENSSILSLPILFSAIFSTTVFVNSQLDILCVGSTNLQEVTKYEIQGMMDSNEANLDAIMDTMMDGLKREIMEGLKFFLIERPPESENVSHEIHDEETRNMNQYWRKSNFGLNNNHFPKIDMRKFHGKDPITWILQME